MAEPTIFIVDDDVAMRSSLVRLVKSVGLHPQTHKSAEEFLGALEGETPGCVVLDVRLPGMSGLDLQEELSARGIMIPIIVISGHGDIPMALRALRAGALDFLEKPFRSQEVLDRIRHAIDLDAENRRQRSAEDVIRRRINRLTPRQREVLDMIAAGYTTVQIARRLGLSPKTVYAHRAEALGKMNTGSVAEAARLLLIADKPRGRPERQPGRA